MRLKHIHIIGEYKNLKDFKLNLDGSGFMDVFVGKNGTGKSNFFEALLEIFKHLYDNDYPIGFNYTVNYEIEGNTVSLTWQDPDWVDSQGKKVPFIAKNLLPTNILIYYSGHNDAIQNFIFDSDEKHRERITRNRNNAAFNQENSRRFFGIGTEYKNLLLAVMLLQSVDIKAKKFIIAKLGIKSLGSEVKMVFVRPHFAEGKNIKFDEYSDEQRFWGVEGFFRTILNRIWNVEKIPNAPIREEGYINKDDREEYILYRSLASFQQTFQDYSLLDLFISLDNLKTIGLLKDISLEVELNSGKKINFNQFSDGQFQSIYIYTIAELFKERNCITLLDEPDSFLHPEWQFDFLKQLKDISSESAEYNHMLMSSHSAITLLNSHGKNVNYFNLQGDNILSHQVKKNYAISQLSANLVKLYQDKEILSIIQSISQDKPILFTEGSTDPFILQQAWNHLYSEEIPFEICFGHGCLYLRLLLQNEKFLREMGALPVFGLFDFDLAYNEWNSLKGEAVLEEADPHKGLIKKIKDKNSYALLVPIPDIPEVKKQAIRENNETFEENSKVELEHLFYNAETQGHFQVIATPGGGEIIEISDSMKLKFASEIVPTIDKRHFEVFKPIFEFIKSKCIIESQNA